MYDLSVVIPAWNRSALLHCLLESLFQAREAYKYGDTEVIVVDSSEGEEKERIRNSCKQFETIYLEGPDSVRKKRNKGIIEAKNPIIVFMDSDVTVAEDVLNLHIETYIESGDENLGGTFGVTEFVGEDSFFWKIVQYTTFVDSFSFAKRFPYQNWTIGNNVTFRKSVLQEIHMFEEAFPFKLGGDDLDMSYRVIKAGYKIKSVPSAVTFHSRETWNHVSAIKDRAKRWGSMEYYLSQRHPEIFIHFGPKTEWVLLVVFLLSGISSLATWNWNYIAGGILCIVLSFIGIFLMDAKLTGKKNIFLYGIAKWFEARYYFYHIVECLKHKSLDGFYKTMSFSYYQTKAMLVRERQKAWILIGAVFAGGLLASLL